MSDYCISRKDFGNGTEGYVFPLTYGRARIGIGYIGQQLFFDEW